MLQYLSALHVYTLLLNSHLLYTYPTVVVPHYQYGVWRSWLARAVWDREVAGSSPATPTI